MTHGTGSGAYLGGISTMLAQSDVCASCGRIHPGRRFGLLGAKSECPAVVHGSMPVLTGSIRADELIPSPPYGEARPRSERLRADPPFPGPIAPRRSSALTVPWPMPSHLEDYQ
jgi:hypothetical protein